MLQELVIFKPAVIEARLSKKRPEPYTGHCLQNNCGKENLLSISIRNLSSSCLHIAVNELINHHYIVAGWIVVGCIVLAISLIWTAVYARQMKEPLDETLHQYIQESYFLNIQLTSPKGKTSNL